MRQRWRYNSAEGTEGNKTEGLRAVDSALGEGCSKLCAAFTMIERRIELLD